MHFDGCDIMFLMYRAISELDNACNPLINGFASKKLIYDMTMSYLEANEKEFLNSLSNVDRDIYCKENMFKYVNGHQYKLKKVIDKRGKVIKNNLDMIEYGDARSIYYLIHCLSTLNTHLISGSRVYTDWISASKDINCLKKYLQKQKINKIAVLECGGELCIDPTIIIDLSSRDIIRNVLSLISKKVNEDEFKEIQRAFDRKMNFLSIPFKDNMYVPTNEKFMGFNYSVCDKELCIYRYFPSERVVSVLEGLQLDLMEVKLFNYQFLTLSKEEQIKQLKCLKEVLKRFVLKLNDSYLLHIFEELYLNNRNINDVAMSKDELEKMKQAKIKILKLARNIPNIQIKR